MDLDQSIIVFDTNLELEDTPIAVRDIFDSYNYIRARVSTHSIEVKKRWAKRRNPKQRSNLLRSIDEDIPVDHRPDIVAVRQYAISVQDKTKKPIMPPEHHILWPHITHDDLVPNGHSLLYFLQARCNSPPGAFMVQDLRSAYLGIEKGKDKEHVRFLELIDELGNHYVECPRNHDGFGYGKLSKTKPKDGDSPPGSLLLILLKIQRGIYRFLARLCNKLLAGIPFSEDERLNVLTHKVDFFIDENDEEMPVSEYGKLHESTMDLSALRIARPYMLHGELNIERLHTFLKNYVTDAEMRVASLKQDPWEFREYIQETKQHRPEHIPPFNESQKALISNADIFPDMASQYEPLPPDPSTDELWEISARQCITLAVEDMLRWNAIEKALQNLIKEYRDFKSNGKSSRFEVSQAAGLLYDVLDPEDWCYPFIFLTHGSRKFRPYFRRLKLPDRMVVKGYSRKLGPVGYVVTLSPSAPKPVELFNSLKLDFELFEMCTRVRPFHLIEAFMFSVNKVKEQKEYSQYLTNMVENKMTHLFWICDICHELDRFGKPPQSPLPAYQEIFRLEMSLVNKEDVWDRLVPLSRAIDKRFRYSHGRVGDAGSVKVRQTSERNLAEFWEVFEDQFYKSSGSQKHQIYAISKVLQVLAAVNPLRTDDWDESKRPGLRRRTAIPAQVKELVQPLGHLDIGGDDKPQTGRAFLVREKEKEKVKGSHAMVTTEAEPALAEEPEPLESDTDADEEDQDDDDEEEEEEEFGDENEIEYVSDDEDDPVGGEEEAEDDGRGKIELKSRKDLKVMRDFFKKGHDAPGSIPWTAFENAMKAIGFHVQNRGGSAHKFSPTKPIPPNGTRIPITLHKGHGARSGKAKGIISRRIQEWRMRLTNEYGWTINTFVLADKDAK